MLTRLANDKKRLATHASLKAVCMQTQSSQPLKWAHHRREILTNHNHGNAHKPHDSVQKKTIFTRTHLLHIHAVVVNLQSDASIIHISMQHRPILCTVTY